MSELIQHNDNRATFRWKLLTSASMLALAAHISAARAEDAGRPVLWLEGGWHFDSIAGSNEILTPPLNDAATKGYPSVPTASNFLGQSTGGLPSFTDMEKSLGLSGGAEGSLSFQPDGSNWVFSISGRYGRTRSRGNLDARNDIYGETVVVKTFLGSHPTVPHATTYVIQASDNSEAHTILDFQVGKDVGIGLFGGTTDSLFSLGVRYAQMSKSSKGHSYAQPGVRFYGYGGINILGKYSYNVINDYQNSSTIIQRHSSFKGIGPSISWSNSTGLAGNLEDGQLALDWGINAALLFGRQKAQVNYSTMMTSNYGVHAFAPAGQITRHKPVSRILSRRATVPNVGGFAGISYRFTNAKLSVGYRADFFFNAMDRGLDKRDIASEGFHGPYASISIGLGD